MAQLSPIAPPTTPRGIPRNLSEELVNLGITTTWAHVLEQAVDDLMKESSPLRERDAALYWFTKDSEMDYAFEFELLCAVSGISAERTMSTMAAELAKRKDEWSKNAAAKINQWLRVRG